MAFQSLDEMRVFRTAEQVADRFYALVQDWQSFEREVVGSQLTRAADSIGANLAESYGRYHYGDKLNFLYFARGSLYETRYWVKRALARKLLAEETAEKALGVLEGLTAQLNQMIQQLRTLRSQPTGSSRHVGESTADYSVPVKSDQTSDADQDAGIEDTGLEGLPIPL